MQQKLTNKNISSIISAIIVISMFLPFISVSINAMIVDVDTSYSGFQALSEGYSGVIGLIILPILIIASDYLQALEKYKTYILIGAPVISILILLIIIPMQIPSSVTVVAEMKISLTRNIGFWIILVSNIALAGLAFLQPANLTVKGSSNTADFSNENKQSTANILPENFSIEKISQAVQKGAVSVKKGALEITEQVRSQVESNKKTLSQEEILKTIKDLHEMKESGVLTEEEFNTKKSELLSNL